MVGGAAKGLWTGLYACDQDQMWAWVAAACPEEKWEKPKI